MNYDESPETTERTSCIRCGTCCRKGGPVLHLEDLEILREGHAGHRHLLTIRKGELAFDPIQKRLGSAEREIVIVRGQGKSWVCHFYVEGDGENDGACSIYPQRFMECRAQKCWDTADLLSIIGKNTIVRADIINPGDPILEIIEAHEKTCPYAEVERAAASLSRGEDESASLERLTDLIRRDLAIRLHTTSELGLDDEHEMFIFGRPIFKVLAGRGFSIHEEDGEIRLRWSPPRGSSPE